MIDFDNLNLNNNPDLEQDLILYFTTRVGGYGPKKIKPTGNIYENFERAAKSINPEIYNLLKLKKIELNKISVKDHALFKKVNEEYLALRTTYPFTNFVVELVNRGGLTEQFELNKSNLYNLSKPINNMLLLSKIDETIILPDGRVYLVGNTPAAGTNMGHRYAALLLNICGIDLSKCIRQTSVASGDYPVFVSMFEYFDMEHPYIKITDEQAQAMHNIYKAVSDLSNISFEETILKSYHLALGINDENRPVYRKYNGLTLEDKLGKGVFDYNQYNKNLIEIYKQQGKLDKTQ